VDTVLSSVTTFLLNIDADYAESSVVYGRLIHQLRSLESEESKSESEWIREGKH